MNSDIIVCFIISILINFVVGKITAYLWLIDKDLSI